MFWDSGLQLNSSRAQKLDWLFRPMCFGDRQMKWVFPAFQMLVEENGNAIFFSGWGSSLSVATNFILNQLHVKRELTWGGEKKTKTFIAHQNHLLKGADVESERLDGTTKIPSPLKSQIKAHVWLLKITKRGKSGLDR